MAPCFLYYSRKLYFLWLFHWPQTHRFICLPMLRLKVYATTTQPRPYFLKKLSSQARNACMIIHSQGHHSEIMGIARVQKFWDRYAPSWEDSKHHLVFLGLLTLLRAELYSLLCRVLVSTGKGVLYSQILFLDISLYLKGDMIQI